MHAPEKQSDEATVIHRCASLVDGRLAVRSARWTRKPKTAQKHQTNEQKR